MGTFADSLFTLLLGWVRGVVNAMMTVVSSGGESGLLTFLGRHWLVIVLVIVAVGLVGDWFIWMVRWQPYRVWGTNMRRVARALHITREEQDAPEDDPETEQAVPAEAYAPEDMMADTMRYQTGAAQEENIDFAPEAQADLDLPPLTQEDEAQAYAAADGVEDAQLGDYPGMRYDMSTYMRPEVPEEGPEIMPEEAQDFDELAAGTSAYGEEMVEEPAGDAPYETFGDEQAFDQDGTDPDAALEEVWNAPAPAASEEEPQDVEFAQELDPMVGDASLVDADADADAGARRRRRRRGDAQDTRRYTAVHSHYPTDENRN